MNVIFLGAPGAGKGTISLKLKEEYNFLVISTGDIFRRAIKNKTLLGEKVKSIVESGNLVSDELTIELVKERLIEKDLQEKSFILDGFPRNTVQAEALYKWKESPKIDFVINFDVHNEALVKRLTGRLLCSSCGKIFHKVYQPPKKDSICDYCQNRLVQRKDDTLESVLHRLDIYKVQTEPLIRYYEKKGILFSIKGDSSQEIVLKEVKNILHL